MTQFRELLSLGFTPAAALAILACIALWARMIIKERSNEKIREAWHRETRAKVDTLSAHVEECNVDRETLKDKISKQSIKIAVMEASIQRMEKCVHPACPNRTA